LFITISAGLLDEITSDATKYLGVNTIPGGLVNVTSVVDLRQIAEGRGSETLDNITLSAPDTHFQQEL
jgi:hypothetical protein